jgi:hypothetical protein
MSISNNTITKIMESNGKLDFKPFICDGLSIETWAYRSNDDTFYFCDNELNIIDRFELQLKWGVIVVLSTPEEYRLISENIEIPGKDVEGTEDSSLNEGWIIEHHNKIVKRIPNFNGYKVIEGHYIFNVFNSKFHISNNNENYWQSTEKAQCFLEDEGLLKESDTYYCGSYLKWDLFYCNDRFYIKEDPQPLCFNRIYFDNPIFWFAHNTARIIDIHKKGESHELSVYKLFVEKGRLNTYNGNWEKYLYDKCECIANYDLGIKSSPDIYNYYVDTVFFLVRLSIKNNDFYLFNIDWEGNMWRTEKSKKDNFISYNHGIVKLETENNYSNNRKYKFINYKGENLASLDEFGNYFIVSKELDTTIIGAEHYDNPQNEKLRFYGVVNGMTGELIVPIKYDYLQLYDGFNYFYAIVKANYLDEKKENKERYGLMYNGNMILPCNNSEIQVFNKNLFIVNEGVKYKIISNGKICVEDCFDEVLPDHYSGKKYLPTGINSAKLTTYDYYWAVILRDGLKGLFLPDWDLYVKPQFTTMIPLIEERFLLADKKLYNIESNQLSFIKDLSKYCYIGGLCHYHLFFIENGNRNCLDNYVCYHLHDAQCHEELIEDIKDHYDNDRLKQIDFFKYGPILRVGGIFYSISEGTFKEDLDDFVSYSSPDPDDGWDYERDTYYALGGSDYDRFKEEGGDIDSMMDGLGF